MKYGIDIGHNCSPDIGAKGIRQEDVMTMEVGSKVVSKLQALGHQVIGCRPSRASGVGNSLQQRCNIANSNNVDVFVSIHFNSFNKQANGTEVFAVSDTGRSIAKRILDNIVKLGYFNRGVKDGSHLYVVRNVYSPAVLVECCFCDNKPDMDRYNAEDIATAIVKGLTGQAAPTPDADDKFTTLELQQALNRLKIRDDNGKPLVEDGSLDKETTAAIKNFQQIVDVTETGIAGATTWLAINQILAKPILRANHAGGTVVKYIQYRVGAETDGVYGPGTAATVEKFQKQNGLTVDGNIGPQSWAKLIG
ncbi:MAG: N-acetylmuramoyl-L-alanine amidase [Cyanobacteriota bacterium]